MIINIDIDNTVNDFVDKFVYYFNGIQDENHKIKPEDIKQYDISKALSVPVDILDVLFFKNDRFHSTLIPLPNAISVITRLNQKGHTVRFVSSIDYNVIQSRLGFIKEFFPFINPHEQLFITTDKSSIYADIVIDDHFRNLENINKDCKFLLFSQPWNDANCSDDRFAKLTYVRVKTWIDIENILTDWGVL